MTGTGSAIAKKQSFFEKIVNYEYKERPDSKEFGEFVMSMRDQLQLSKRIG